MGQIVSVGSEFAATLCQPDYLFEERFLTRQLCFSCGNEHVPLGAVAPNAVPKTVGKLMVLVEQGEEDRK